MAMSAYIFSFFSFAQEGTTSRYSVKFSFRQQWMLKQFFPYHVTILIHLHRVGLLPGNEEFVMDCDLVLVLCEDLHAEAFLHISVVFLPMFQLWQKEWIVSSLRV